MMSQNYMQPTLSFQDIDRYCDVLLHSATVYINAYVTVNKRIPLVVSDFDEKFKSIREVARVYNIQYPFRVVRNTLDTVLYMASLNMEKTRIAEYQRAQQIQQMKQ